MKKRSNSGAIWKSIARYKLRGGQIFLPTTDCALRMCCAITVSMKELKRRRIPVRRIKPELLNEDRVHRQASASFAYKRSNSSSSVFFGKVLLPRLYQ